MSNFPKPLELEEKIEGQTCETTKKALESKVAEKIFRIIAPKAGYTLQEFLNKNDYTIHELKFIVRFFYEKSGREKFSSILDRIQLKDSVGKIVDNESLISLKESVFGFQKIIDECLPKIINIVGQLMKIDQNFLFELGILEEKIVKNTPQSMYFYIPDSKNEKKIHTVYYFSKNTRRYEIFKLGNLIITELEELSFDNKGNIKNGIAKSDGNIEHPFIRDELTGEFINLTDGLIPKGE